MLMEAQGVSCERLLQLFKDEKFRIEQMDFSLFGTMKTVCYFFCLDTDVDFQIDLSFHWQGSLKVEI
jgi:hypothetical protein